MRGLMTTSARLAEKLKEYRKKEGLTQEQMADKLGVTRMTYGYYENAKRTPDIEFLDNLHTLTGYTMEYLLGKSECRTIQEEAEAARLAPDGMSSSGVAAKRAYPIIRMTKNLLAKYDQEGEGVLDVYLQPLADLSNAIDEMIRQFVFGQKVNNEWTKQMYANFFGEPKLQRDLFLKAWEASNDLLKGGF